MPPPPVIRARPKSGHSRGHGHGSVLSADHGTGMPTEEQLNNLEWRKQNSRLDDEKFRGLREEMKGDVHEPTPLSHKAGNGIVMFTILVNSMQMGAAVQDKEGHFETLWSFIEHLCTAIFTVEMFAKLYFDRKRYFHSTWNLMDFFLVWMSVLSNWIFPLANIKIDVSVFLVIRLMRCLRIVKLLRAAPALKLLVEGMFKSMVSLGWILVLLGIITYLFAIICTQVLDYQLYADMLPLFDVELYFGDMEKAMLTMFNMCILAEWIEVVRPVWERQPHVVLCVFLPYLMLGTFGVLNLIIGVIAEQTMAATSEANEVKEKFAEREKMKAILRLTDSMFGADNVDKTKHEFIDCALRHPDFVELMRSCAFPRGFELEHLHGMFDESCEGTVDKTEFVNGIFRLVFNDESQHACTIELGISQLKFEIKTQIEEELHKISAHFGIQCQQDGDVEAAFGSQVEPEKKDGTTGTPWVPMKPQKVSLVKDKVDAETKDANLDVAAKVEAPKQVDLKPKVVDMTSRAPAERSQNTETKEIIGLVEDVRVTHHSDGDDLDMQAGNSQMHVKTDEQMAQISSLLRTSTDATKAQASTVNTEFAEIRRELLTIQDKLAQGPAGGVATELDAFRRELLSDRALMNPSELAAQVARAIQPLLSKTQTASQPTTHLDAFASPPSYAPGHRFIAPAPPSGRLHESRIVPR